MKKLLLLIILLILIIVGSGGFYYYKLKQEIISKQVQDQKDIKSELIKSAEQSVRIKNLFLFEQIVKNIQKRTTLQNVTIKINKNIIDYNYVITRAKNGLR